MSSGQPDVSLVVAAHNEAATIGELIDAVEAQTLPTDRFELVIVNDGSSDETAAAIDSRSLPKLVDSKENVGLPSARNLGANAATGEVLSFTDGDCVPNADYLEKGVAHFLEDPNLQMMGAQVDFIMPPDPPLASMLDLISNLRSGGNLDRGGHVLGCVTWIRRSFFEQLGGYNENLANYGAEDTELTACATAANAKFKIIQDARIGHPARTSLRQLARKSYALGYGRAYLSRVTRHPVPRKPLLLDPRSYLPAASLKRTWRISDAGFDVTPTLRLKLIFAEFFFQVLPRLAGHLVGQFKLRNAARRSR